MNPDKPLVLVVGGSLGARTINESIARYINDITNSDAQILWQTGKLYADECAQIAHGHTDVQAMPFISDMATAYRADIVVARAGAGTISELQLLGLPSILVPSPNVAEDHQRKNAQALVDADAAVMVLDADARNQLGNAITSLLNDENKRNTLARNIRSMAMEQSDEKIVDRIYQLLK